MECRRHHRFSSDGFSFFFLADVHGLEYGCAGLSRAQPSSSWIHECCLLFRRERADRQPEHPLLCCVKFDPSLVISWHPWPAEFLEQATTLQSPYSSHSSCCILFMQFCWPLCRRQPFLQSANALYFPPRMRGTFPLIPYPFIRIQALWFLPSRPITHTLASAQVQQLY